MANPYQAPQYSPQQVPAPSSGYPAPLPVIQPYSRIGPVAYLFIGIVVFQLILAMAAIGASVLTLDYLHRASTGFRSEQEANFVDFLEFAISLLRLPIFFVAIIVYLVWFYRAYRNLPSLRAVEVYTSPGCAVGFHFIPIANLYFVYRGMREIWLGSHPKDLHALRSPMIKHLMGATTVGFWWGLHLASGFLGTFSVRLVEMGARQQNISIVKNAVLISIGSDLLHITAGLLLISIVYFSTLHQDERFELIRRLG
ncbi:MAG: DUF4328 domain-containing protein [Pirellulaceae bacterium]|nr:DUF4328 domain-containing protein [Pirellulaceae bacterium]